MSILTDSRIGSWNQNTTIIPASEVVPGALVLDKRICTQVPAPEGDQASVRVPFIPSDPNAEVVPEGAEIPFGDVTRAEITIYSRKIGLLQAVSNEAYGRYINADNGNAAVSDLLTDSLRRAIAAKADSLFLNYSDTADTWFAPGLCEDKTDAVIDGGAITDTMDPLLDALATLGDNGSNPTAILVSNSGWARLRKIKFADGRPLIGDTIQADATPILCGLPVIRTAAMPKDKLLIVDASNIITTFNDVQVAVDASSMFTADSTVIRVLSRIGWAIIQRGRIAKLAIGATAPAPGTRARHTTTIKSSDLEVG